MPDAFDALALVAIVELTSEPALSISAKTSSAAADL